MIQMWETIGQERYRSLAKMFHRKAFRVLAVFDMNDEYSALKLVSWLKMVNDAGGDPVIDFCSFLSSSK